MAESVKTRSRGGIHIRRLESARLSKGVKKIAAVEDVAKHTGGGVGGGGEGEGRRFPTSLPKAFTERWGDDRTDRRGMW